ncbi:hypothetical protein PL321_07310 [Caloramator sp. mosi_1]|nr:hypothetical protein [Caloramator sp. mosi_1]WDC85252.1 hypothetical protein PL321_07310 [Caloramator sp. mosi_1]
MYVVSGELILEVNEVPQYSNKSEMPLKNLKYMVELKNTKVELLLLH